MYDELSYTLDLHCTTNKENSDIVMHSLWNTSVCFSQLLPWLNTILAQCLFKRHELILLQFWQKPIEKSIRCSHYSNRQSNLQYAMMHVFGIFDGNISFIFAKFSSFRHFGEQCLYYF